MAKIIDITDKLNFEQKPQLRIKDTILSVNNEAIAFLTILPKLNGDITLEAVNEMCSILFDRQEIQKIKDLNLNLKDFIILIQSAIELIAGEKEMGETATHTTI